MKRLFIRLMSVLFIIITVSVTASGDDIDVPSVKAVKETGKVVAVLPFYNYSGSSPEFLSSYFPEIIEREIRIAKRVMVMDRRKTAAALKESGMSNEDLFDDGKLTDALRALGAGVGIAGRYLSDGSSLRLHCKIIFTDSGRISSSDEFRGTVDNNIIEVAEACAARATEWIKIEAFSNGFTGLDDDRLGFLKFLFVAIKESRAELLVQNRWIFSLLIFVIFYILSLAVRSIIVKILHQITSRTRTTVDDGILEAARGPLRWLIVFFGIKLALLPLGLSTPVFSALNKTITAGIIGVAGIFLLKIVEMLLKEWGKSATLRIETRISEDLVPLFTKISRILILIITALLVMSRFGIEIAPLVASLGIVGFAIGFAVKDTLANIIGGIILILDQSFAVGDKVSIDGDVGIVRDVGLRNTQLLTYDNEVILIPNGELMNKKFKNFALPDPAIRVVVNFSVAYGSDVDKVEETVLGVITAIEQVNTDPAPEVIFDEMADFSLNFKARFWIPLFANQFTKKVEATKRIYNALNQAKISIPFPTHTVYLEKKGEG